MEKVAEVGLWWLALFAVYVTTLSSPAAPELAAGASVALVAAFAAFAARRAMQGAWRPRAGWVRWAASVPWPAVRDSCRALVTVFRDPDAGHRETLRLPGESPATTAARQAVATVAIGCTPGSMVIAAPEGERILVLHRLFDGPAPIDERVSR
ncbi:Na+/H+ antiporter subunit E [Amycolatopsis acidicola]|uniref:Na+/H+ antiporter subunit E n=1 Tax=Amycolatopsis acidicola TaxID=2596893 RepID=UPI00140D3E08|nr:Na+/H+ antiporter subunit E [Amycolatopsis acidicola]